MPNRVQWNPSYSMGNDILDDQHRNILAQCNILADCLSDDKQEDDQAGDLKFDNIFNELMAHARAHFLTEEELLSHWGYPGVEAHQNEQAEFEYLAANIITAGNFDKIERQRFLALWWVGHVTGSAKNYGALFAKQASA
jgi:hemerythrin